MIRLGRCLFPILLLLSLCAATASAQYSDTVKTDRPDSVLPAVPGERPSPFSPEQDSAFRRELEVKVTAANRFRDHLRRDSLAWRAYLASLDNSRAAIIKRNLALDPSMWLPSDADKAKRLAEIAHSQDYDHIFAGDIAYIPLVSVPLSSIGQFLGITEDVSPKISYTVRHLQGVTIKIYNIDAELVAVMLDAPQGPGTYRFEWNMRDEYGRRVEPGDYFAEVIGGNQILFTKRIVVP